MLYPAGRRTATLLCKLRIIRQSEFKITSGALDGERATGGLSDHVEGRRTKASVFVWKSTIVCACMCASLERVCECSALSCTGIKFVSTCTTFVCAWV